jgi:hypothetical protein
LALKSKIKKNKKGTLLDTYFNIGCESDLSTGRIENAENTERRWRGLEVGKVRTTEAAK